MNLVKRDPAIAYRRFRSMFPLIHKHNIDDARKALKSIKSSEAQALDAELQTHYDAIIKEEVDYNTETNQSQPKAEDPRLHYSEVNGGYLAKPVKPAIQVNPLDYAQANIKAADRELLDSANVQALDQNQMVTLDKQSQDDIDKIDAQTNAQVSAARDRGASQADISAIIAQAEEEKKRIRQSRQDTINQEKMYNADVSSKNANARREASNQKSELDMQIQRENNESRRRNENNEKSRKFNLLEVGKNDIDAHVQRTQQSYQDTMAVNSALYLQKKRDLQNKTNEASKTYASSKLKNDTLDQLDKYKTTLESISEAANAADPKAALQAYAGDAILGGPISSYLQDPTPDNLFALKTALMQARSGLSQELLKLGDRVSEEDLIKQKNAFSKATADLQDNTTNYQRVNVGLQGEAYNVSNPVGKAITYVNRMITDDPDSYTYNGLGVRERTKID